MVPLTESLAVVLTFPKSRSTINFMGFNCDISHWCLLMHVYIYNTLRKKQNSSLLHFRPHKNNVFTKMLRLFRRSVQCPKPFIFYYYFQKQVRSQLYSLRPPKLYDVSQKMRAPTWKISTHSPTCRRCPSWGGCCMARSRARKWPVRSSWAKRCQLRWTKTVDFTSPEVLTLFAPFFSGAKQRGKKLLRGVVWLLMHLFLREKKEKAWVTLDGEYCVW